jgi:hypothetical protein
MSSKWVLLWYNTRNSINGFSFAVVQKCTPFKAHEVWVEIPTFTMRAVVLCALGGLVPAQAFMNGGMLPMRSAALASAPGRAPLRSHAPSLPLHRR